MNAKRNNVDVSTGEVRSEVFVPFVRNPYNYSMEDASDASALRCLDASRTIQSGAEEADINTIVKRFGLTGKLPENVPNPMWGDFTSVPDFRESLHLVMAAEKAFDSMPSDIRTRFNNDPGIFHDFFSKEENRAEGEKLGLVVPKPVVVEPPPMRVEVVNVDKAPKPEK